MTKADGDDSLAADRVNGSAPRRKSVVLGWIVLALIVIALPAQAAWYTLMSSEPYPALTQPPFRTVPGADGTLSGQTKTLTAVLADGSSVELDADELFSESWNQGSFVVESVAGTPDLDARSRAQLRAEIAKFVPAEAVITHLRIVTEEREYLLDENRSYSVSEAKTVLIPLGDAE